MTRFVIDVMDGTRGREGMLTTWGAHVLVIDDEPESLASLLRALREPGWRVSVCTGGRQGFHRAQALVPDLIVLDRRMADMDGLVTCRLLLESPRTCDIPIVFLSSASAGADRLTGLNHGAVDYVTKPFLPAEVVARIRIHLRRSTYRASMPATGPMPLLSQGEVVLRAAMRLIGANLAELPPLAEIARQVGTHDKKLSAIFREHLGQTVFAWVREERLRVSREWLAESRMSIHDVAAQVGFRSAANFATAFRARMGVTPSQYRASLRETGEGSGVDGG